LYVKSDGSWTYDLVDNTTDHTDPSKTGEADQVKDIFDFGVRDGDGNIASSSLTINVNDDGPSISSVGAAIVENSADALNAVGSSLLQMGADQNGHADLTGNIAGWNGGSVTCGLSALTSGEQPVYYSVSPSSPGVLFAYTSSSAVPYGTSGASQSLIFTLTYGADGHYTLDMNGTLDAPKHSYSDTFNENIGGNFDYLLLGSDGTLYKPTDTIPTTAKIVMTIDASGTSTVNSSTQGLGVSNGWITSSESLIMKFTNPVVSAQFSIDTQSGDATNIVTWTVHGMAANGTLTTQTGTTSFSDGVMTSIPTTLTHITQIDLSDQSGSGYRVNGTELVYRVEEEPINTNLAVAIVDADGDKATSSLAVTFTPAVEDLLVVGTNANDISGSTAPYVTPVDFGAIDGGKGNDILIGDEGRATLVGKSVNVILMLDVSGSMTDTIQFNGGWTTRLEALKSAVENLLDDLKDSKATNVRVELISFSDSATNLGVFDLKTPSELAAALSQVANLHDDNMTNYEAALQMALAWAKSSGPDAPLSGSNVVNQAIFISDGLPNTWITQSGHISSGTTGNAISQFLGGDGTNEVTELERVFGSIQAVGINVDAAALDVLNQVEGEAASVTPDAATNITTAEQLNQVLADLNPELHFSPAGRDTITGGDGKDLIFGDAPFTDNLATAAGLSIAAGGGWQVFAELEAGRGLGSYAGWDRADTLQYINAHLVELSQESGRTGGNDILDGGAGDDILFGQEGDDTMTGGSGADLLSGGSGVDRIDGGTGNDTLRGGLGADILTGGDGADTFVFMAADKDGTRDTITDFTLNQDKLDLRDVLNDPTGNLGDYLKITQSGDDALVNVYSAGNASAGGTPSVTIVLDGLGSNATELSQLQDYLINHDGVIK
ncbi:MAG: VWA domain-containing protein, partial [Aeromonadaceae bacterium]